MKKPSPAMVVALLALVAAMGGLAIAANQSATTQKIRACYSKKTGDLRIVKGTQRCRRNEQALRWNKRGRRGVAGPAGTKGDQGEQGPKGDPGAPAGFGGETAGGVLSGTYPDPGFASGAVGTDALADGAVTANKLAATAVGASKLGLQTALDQSPIDSQSPKTAIANCPAGTSIMSGGAAITDGVNPLRSVAALSYDGIYPFLNGWYGTAYEPVGTSTSWAIQVIAICMRN